MKASSINRRSAVLQYTSLLSISTGLARRLKTIILTAYLLIELMRLRLRNVSDGKREGDAEAEVDTPGFAKGLRLYISVKKSSDTVGGQDVSGMNYQLN